MESTIFLLECWISVSITMNSSHSLVLQRQAKDLILALVWMSDRIFVQIKMAKNFEFALVQKICTSLHTQIVRNDLLRKSQAVQKMREVPKGISMSLYPEAIVRGDAF